MKLSSKALRFVIDAVRFHADHLEQIADDEAEDEDVRADAGNDMQFLREIAKDLEAERRRQIDDPDAR